MSDLRRRKVSSGSDQERKTKTPEVYKAKSTVVVLELSSVLCIVFGVLIGKYINIFFLILINGALMLLINIYLSFN